MCIRDRYQRRVHGPNDQPIPHGIFSNSLHFKAIIRHNLELWRNIERVLVIEWVHGKLMNDHQLYLSKVESIQEHMLNFEKLLLLLQNHELSNNLDKSPDVKALYLAKITNYKETILPKLSQLLTDQLKVEYQLTSPLVPFNSESNTISDPITLLLFYNPTAHSIQRPIKLKLPNSNYRLLSSQNYELPMDIICTQNECSMYFLL
eukprot:TRINITY_DN3376_c0_g1_i6.p1 TRINITY_DN3376_c0_g1~~TRINITY_DN3376_c0_g1_i6.p1  ORF type:complete len:205 (-),score=20.55 TRINITY_DN3376_c0_g1_i6:341-955(-)